MLSELLGADKLEHLSVGDMIRTVSKTIQNPQQKQELIDYLSKNYRGWLPIEQLIPAIEGRDTKTLLPTELILALIKREISQYPKKQFYSMVFLGIWIKCPILYFSAI